MALSNWSRCCFMLGAWLSTRALAAAEATPSEPPAATPPSPSNAPRPSEEAQLDLLTFYKDNYFITGFTMDTEAKFQFSAKFDIWPNRGKHAAYFAFTQKSLWDIYRTSQPFTENDYAPELFYSYFHAPGRYDPAPGCGFFLERGGVIHESTGEQGDNSRGWNRVYGESRFACYDAAHRYLALALQLWAPPFGVADNPDIASYLGYGELSLSVGSDRGRGWLGDWELQSHLRKGTKNWSVGSLELNGRWRPRYGDFWRFTPYLYAQLFSGYGETLLSYDRATTAFRIGIGFTDLSTRSE
ncbi:MAG TPA: phospholipase A [Polyangiaceae bacterium]|nr:phospholipase A [Polyangiaceae bacterium]